MRIIPKRHRDPQRRVPAGECALCGGDLYPGQHVWKLWGRLLCEDCAARWVLEELAACRIRLGEVEQ